MSEKPHAAPRPLPQPMSVRQGLDKDLLEGSPSCSATLPSGPFLTGAFSWSSGWPCPHSVFCWDPVAALPNAVPPSLARELTLLCGPGFRAFNLFCGLESPCQGPDTWRTKLTMGYPLQWPVRKCHWTQGRTQRHLFQLGGHLNVKNCCFSSFEDFYRS